MLFGPVSVLERYCLCCRCFVVAFVVGVVGFVVSVVVAVVLLSLSLLLMFRKRFCC